MSSRAVTRPPRRPRRRDTTARGRGISRPSTSRRSPVEASAHARRRSASRPHGPPRPEHRDAARTPGRYSSSSSAYPLAPHARELAARYAGRRRDRTGREGRQRLPADESARPPPPAARQDRLRDRAGERRQPAAQRGDDLELAVRLGAVEDHRLAAASEVEDRRLAGSRRASATRDGRAGSRTSSRPRTAPARSRRPTPRRNAAGARVALDEPIPLEGRRGRPRACSSRRRAAAEARRAPGPDVLREGLEHADRPLHRRNRHGLPFAISNLVRDPNNVVRTRSPVKRPRAVSASASDKGVHAAD